VRGGALHDDFAHALEFPALVEKSARPEPPGELAVRVGGEVGQHVEIDLGRLRAHRAQHVEAAGAAGEAEVEQHDVGIGIGEPRPGGFRGLGERGPVTLAFERAGLRHEDVHVCAIYDSYTITVLATLEALGFCRPGEGGAFCAGGRIGLGGALPVNPDGGGLSSNHPGMRGIFLVVEATRQLRGECGARQVPGAEIALVHGTGGFLGFRHSGVTLLLGRA